MKSPYRVLGMLPLFMLFLMTQEGVGANSKVGTSGAQFLKIGGGARPAGMGEAFTGVADDANAVAWNPAGLSGLEKPEILAMHSQWLRQSHYEFLAAAYPTRWGTFGLGLASLSVDNIEKRLTDTDAPDGTFDASDSLYGISYGRPLGDKWSAGVTAKFIRQEIDGQTASAFSGDVGTLWKTPHDPLTVGISIRHFGQDIKFVEEGDPLPLTYGLGFGYTLFQERLLMAVDVRKPRDNDMQYALGGEWKQALFRDLSGRLRAGYNNAANDITDGLTGVSVGGGLTWRQFSFDTAWVPYGLLGETFRYAFHVKF